MGSSTSLDTFFAVKTMVSLVVSSGEVASYFQRTGYEAQEHH